MQSSVLHICCLIISQVSPGLVSISHLPKAQLIAAAAQKGGHHLLFDGFTTVGGQFIDQADQLLGTGIKADCLIAVKKCLVDGNGTGLIFPVVGNLIIKPVAG